MNTLWHKLWADLWTAKSRSLLIILNLAAGIFCIGTLYGMIDLQLSKMDAAHRQSQPSHINLLLRSDADLSLLPTISAMPGVAGIDTMTQLSVPFRRPGDSDWQMATLIIRPDYQNQSYDRTVLQSGLWPADDQLAIENMSVQFSGLNVQDSVEFKTEDGIKRLPIVGIVRHPFIKQPKFGGQVHFFAAKSSARLFRVAGNSFRQCLVQITPPYSPQKAAAVASDIRSQFSKQQIAVNATLLQDPEKHWGRPFLAGVNAVMQLLALAALILASVLIFNTVSAHITQQTDQIGVMKALGGSTVVVFILYLSELLLLALAAVLAAVAPSLFAASISSCHLLALFNVDCAGFDFSWRALVYMLLAGFLVPCLAAMVPILRGATISVRVAIASYGLAADFGSSRLDVWIERLGARLLPTLYAAALGNIFRNKARLVLTQSVLIIAGVLFLLLMSLIASLNLTLDNEVARSRYSVKLGFSSPQAEQQVIDIASVIPETQAVEIWQRLAVELSKDTRVMQQKGSLGIQLLALPSDGQLYQPLIQSGRWFMPADAGENVLVLNADTARLSGIKAGDKLDMAIGPLKQVWQVIGTYRWLAGNQFAVEPVYAPRETIKKYVPVQGGFLIALFQAATEGLAEESDYLRQLKQRFQAHGMPLDVYSTQAKLEQRQFLHNQFKPVLNTLFGLASLIVAVGGIGLSGTLGINVLQRTREIGVLRAIGASSKAVFRLFLLEGLLHGAFAWLLSLPLAYCLAEPVAGALGRIMLGIQLDFAFDGWAVVYWLGIVCLLTVLASYWPARKASGMTIRRCFEH